MVFGLTAFIFYRSLKAGMGLAAIVVGLLTGGLLYYGVIGGGIEDIGRMLEQSQAHDHNPLAHRGPAPACPGRQGRQRAQDPPGALLVWQLAALPLFPLLWHFRAAWAGGTAAWAPWS